MGEEMKTRKKEKSKNDKEKQATKDGFENITTIMGMFGDFLKEAHKEKVEKEVKDKEEKEKKEQKEAEKEEKEKAKKKEKEVNDKAEKEAKEVKDKVEKEEKEEKDKAEKQATRTWMIGITKDRNHVVQAIAEVQN